MSQGPSFSAAAAAPGLPEPLARDLGGLKLAARVLRSSPSSARNAVLAGLERRLGERETEILAANAQDLAAFPADGTLAFRDRLTLNAKRLAGMRESLRQVAELADPLGEVVEERRLANGLLTRRVRSSLGVIFMIFESRPNVAIEAFSLALKSGNALILRGGKESARTVGVFYALMREALAEAGLPGESLVGITDPDRSIVHALLQAKSHIDVVVPRGGDKLIEFVVENSRIPIIKNDRGLCHVYLHEDADLEMARSIVRNAKVSRPGVCNSMETLLVHERIASGFLPVIRDALPEVKFHVCDRAYALLSGKPGVDRAKDKNFDTEYLDLEMSVKVVDSLGDAIAHVERHGSRHSEAIVTRDEKSARVFQTEVDAAAVYWNASTRFTDGFELGLGGELGISTQKLHVRGPVGLRELTSVRWIMDGQGHIRE